jgi:hypothetical protein
MVLVTYHLHLGPLTNPLDKWQNISHSGTTAARGTEIHTLEEVDWW